MKKFFTTLTAGTILSVSSFAQVGATAPDFTVTDLDGNSHNLYTLLNSGLVVVLDCSATWCGPCWGFHGTGYLQQLHDDFGPAGTNQLRVIFYEADAATTLADLQGTGGSTQGDWLTGHTFPFINEAPLTLNGSVYWPLGYPTINVISPADKKIKADLWDTYISAGSDYNDIVNVVDDHFMVSASVEETTNGMLSVYPNPVNQTGTITFNVETPSTAVIEVYSLLGEKVITTNTETVSGLNKVNMDFSNLAAGQYTAQVKLPETVLNVKFNVAH
ncbi:MAG: T9SS type A sorting domain-containing protein [Crocinitomicaceae bacterium]|nr:T9SS type A sorting domain-containing protein [Crocinitomicaceae bacterium]